MRSEYPFTHIASTSLLICKVQRSYSLRLTKEKHRSPPGVEVGLFSIRSTQARAARQEGAEKAQFGASPGVTSRHPWAAPQGPRSPGLHLPARLGPRPPPQATPAEQGSVAVEYRGAGEEQPAACPLGRLKALWKTCATALGSR